MLATEIIQYITSTFTGVEMAENFGYTFFFYGADHKLPFATLATADNDYDRVSNLDRPGVFRLNIGVSPATYRTLFGAHPASPVDKGVVATGHDFTALDQLLPHPVYAPQSWVCVLTPSDATFEKAKPLLAEAYAIAGRRHPL